MNGNRSVDALFCCSSNSSFNICVFLSSRLGSTELNCNRKNIDDTHHHFVSINVSLLSFTITPRELCSLSHKWIMHHGDIQDRTTIGFGSSGGSSDFILNKTVYYNKNYSVARWFYQSSQTLTQRTLKSSILVKIVRFYIIFSVEGYISRPIPKRLVKDFKFFKDLNCLSPCSKPGFGLVFKTSQKWQVALANNRSVIALECVVYLATSICASTRR